MQDSTASMYTSGRAFACAKELRGLRETQAGRLTAKGKRYVQKRIKALESLIVGYSHIVVGYAILGD